MTVDLVAVLFVASALIAIGAFTAVWRKDAAAGLAGVPLMLGGAGIAFIGVTRFAARSVHELVGQEMAILLAVTAVALLALGLGFAGREGSR